MKKTSKNIDEMNMLEVESLRKYYAGTAAVNNISFNVKAGEIVGFLGPNGAGKSTTMKILAGYLSPHSGVVRIGGVNVFKNRIAIQKKIGYMPEDNPLYLEMRVSKYLTYRARIKGVSRKEVKGAVERVLGDCQLGDVRNKVIRHLSKGYRQRVGLADALVHDPEFLILDEPTIGLDPSQIRTVRNLIKSLAKKHTILISTHILSEVEMMCQRVIIINKGIIEASDTTSNLTQIRRKVALHLELEEGGDSEKEIEKVFKESLGSVKVEISPMGKGWNKVIITSKRRKDFREQTYQIVKNKGWNLREMMCKKTSLEDVFMDMTQD